VQIEFGWRTRRNTMRLILGSARRASQLRLSRTDHGSRQRSSIRIQPASVEISLCGPKQRLSALQLLNDNAQERLREERGAGLRLQACHQGEFSVDYPIGDFHKGGARLPHP